jgi:hypothetical protein
VTQEVIKHEVQNLKDEIHGLRNHIQKLEMILIRHGLNIPKLMRVHGDEDDGNEIE